MLKKSLWSNYLSVGNVINLWSSDLFALNLRTLSRLRGLWSLMWFALRYDLIRFVIWYDAMLLSSHLQSGGHCLFELRKVCFHHQSAHQKIDVRQNWHQLLCPMEPVHSAVDLKVSSADSARCVLRRGSACHLHHWSPERVSVTVRYLVGKKFARHCRSVCLRKHYQVLMVDHDHHLFEVLLPHC